MFKRIFVLFVGVYLWSASTAFGQSCGGYTASPDDWYPDDNALQCLLNNGGTIYLNPTWFGPGYIIERGLRVVHPYTAIMSSDGYRKATLLASSRLRSACILEGNVNNVTLLLLRFDGNRDARDYRNLCGATRHKTGPVELRGNNIYVGYNEFVRTMCGAALLVEGDNFTIESNGFGDSGFGRETFPNPTGGFQPWADGVRSGTCTNSRIWYNTFTDTTDVGVSLGNTTSGCKVTNNVFQQLNRWAFAAAGFPNGTHYGSEISNNTIEGNGKMSFGLAIGARPWGNPASVYGGSVSGNTVSGARVNLNAEDIVDTYIDQNSLSNYYNGAYCTPGGQGTNCNVYNAPGVSQAGCVFLATFNNCIP